MNKWRSEENHNILDIDYKDLVTNTDVAANKIWSFCNIQENIINQSALIILLKQQQTSS